MSRENIFSVPSAKYIMSPAELIRVLEYFIEQRDCILPTHRAEDLLRHRGGGNTVANEVVSNIVSSGKSNRFSMIRYPLKTTQLRETADSTFVPFDILQMREASHFHNPLLTTIPELSDVMLINVTDLTRANGDLADVGQMQWRVTRDFLSRSYYMDTSSIWISPQFVRYIAKAYSTVIAYRLSKLFGLSPMMMTFVRTVFCHFYLTKMTDPKSSGEFAIANSRELGFYDKQEVAQTIAYAKDVLGKDSPESLEDVFAVIDAQNHTSMFNRGKSRLTRAVLSTTFQSIYPDSHISAIALEYPPYFALLSMMVASGMRIGLSVWMKFANLEKEGRLVFEQTTRSPAFLKGL